MILSLSSADGGMTVGLWKLSSLDGRRSPWYWPQASLPALPDRVPPVTLHWYYSDSPAKRLAWYCQCWNWLTRYVYSVTGRESKFDLSIAAGTFWADPRRSSHVPGTLSNWKTTRLCWKLKPEQAISRLQILRLFVVYFNLWTSKLCMIHVFKQQHKFC